MRTYTLVFSIVAHVCIACALLFTTVLATDELPALNDGAVFIAMAAPPPPTVTPPPPRARVEPIVNTSAAPTEASVGITPEIERPIPIDIGDSAPVGVIGGIGSDAGLALRDEPPPPPPPAPVTPVRVGSLITPPTRVGHVAPVYPEIARAAHISGLVILEATVSEDGRVRDVRVLRSVPLLDDAATNAVRQWTFTPTTLNGHAVAVLMTVTVSFTLDR